MPFVKGKSGNDKKKFKPGTSGNLKGRPPVESLSTILNKLMLGKIEVTDGTDSKGNPINKRKITKGEAIALRLIQKAASGDIRAIRELYDRTEGKPKQTVDLSSNGKPIQAIPPQVVIENPNNDK